MKVLVAASVSVAVLALAGCGGGDSNDAADQQAIESVASQYASTAADGDFAATCKLFTPDSLARIEKLKVFGSCQELMKAGLGSLPEGEIEKLGEISDLQVDGDTATAQSRGETIKFRKIDGEWKLDVSDPGQ